MHTSIGDDWGLPGGPRRRAQCEPEIFVYLKKKKKDHFPEIGRGREAVAVAVIPERTSSFPGPACSSWVSEKNQTEQAVCQEPTFRVLFHVFSWKADPPPHPRRPSVIYPIAVISLPALGRACHFASSPSSPVV